MNLFRPPTFSSRKSVMTTSPSMRATRRTDSMFSGAAPGSGPAARSTYGLAAISASGLDTRSSMKRTASSSERLFSIQVISRSAGSFSSTGICGGGEQGAVDDLRPLDQLGHRAGVEAELLGHACGPGSGRSCGRWGRRTCWPLGVGAEMGLVARRPGRRRRGDRTTSAGGGPASSGSRRRRWCRRRTAARGWPAPPPCAPGARRPRPGAPPWRSAPGRTG